MGDGGYEVRRVPAATRLITLGVHEHNERAHAFYLRYGFVDTGERMPYDLDPAVQIIDMRYEG